VNIFIAIIILLKAYSRGVFSDLHWKISVQALMKFVFYRYLLFLGLLYLFSETQEAHQDDDLALYMKPQGCGGLQG